MVNKIHQNQASSTGHTGEIRAEIARQRKRSGDLSGLLGLSQSAVSSRLTGKQPLTVSELLKIADWLGVEPNTLIDSHKGTE